MEVITKTNKKFYPLKSYCYYIIPKLVKSIYAVLSLLDLCEHWQNRVIPENILADMMEKYGRSS